MLTSLREEDKEKIKEILLNKKEHIGINITFPEIKKELIL